MEDFPIAQSVTLMHEEEFGASSHQSSRNNNRSRTSNNNAVAKNKTIPANLIEVTRLADPSQADDSSERGHQNDQAFNTIQHAVARARSMLVEGQADNYDAPTIRNSKRK